MQEPIEQRGDGGGVAEQLVPVLDRPVRGDARGGAFVAKRLTISSRSSAAVGGSLRMPRSSMTSSGTVVRWASVALRVRRSDRDAPCGGRTGSSEMAPGAAGASSAAPRGTSPRPGAWWCRGCGCRPSRRPSNDLLLLRVAQEISMAAQGPRSSPPRQCLERLPPMDGFQVSSRGPFWVSTEAPAVRRRGVCPKTRR
jgi:hypothetical protein